MDSAHATITLKASVPPEKQLPRGEKKNSNYNTIFVFVKSQSGFLAIKAIKISLFLAGYRVMLTAHKTG